MNKKYSIMTGILAGGLLLSANTTEAAMINGNSPTTSESKTSFTYQLQSPYKVMYNYNLNNSDIQELINEELKNLKPLLIKEIEVAKNSVVNDKAPEVEKPSTPEKPPVVEKPTTPEKPPVVEKPTTPETPPVVEKPTTPEAPPVEEKPATPVTPPVANEPVNDNKNEVKVSAVIQQVVDLTNQERAKAGLKPLKIDAKLSQSAQAKSQDMKNKNYFSHTSPTYGSPFDQMKSNGITYKTAGENIAMGQRTAAEVMDAWMKSPGHRENILNPAYTHIGVGLSDSGFYWTQQFIGK